MQAPYSLVELVSLQLLNIDFDLIDPVKATKGGSYELGCFVKFNESPDDESSCPSEINADFMFKVRGVSDNETSFQLKLELKTTITINDLDTFGSLEEDKRVTMCIPVVFPYVREDANYIFRRAGFGQLELPFSIIDGDLEAIPPEEYENLKLSI